MAIKPNHKALSEHAAPEELVEKGSSFGEPRAYYVAPILETISKKKVKVIGERLTDKIPSTGGQYRYYVAKGFRLASQADIERLRPEPKEDE